ncbi:MAG: flagellar motor switch protein FliG [Firmicutes bacterium]|nr:flagellar motor switch protein FliG [Bacillota bacterium]HXL04555.1 flagellar motor switch protein FliG [Bacillota bacterium]
MISSVKTYSELSGKEKAAITVVALGARVASEIFQHLDERKIEQLTMEIANLGRVPPDLKEQVLDEFYDSCESQKYISGDLSYVQQVLERALGRPRAIEIVEKIAASLQEQPFSFAREIDASQLTSFIENEHPQTIALVLAHLHTDQAASVLSLLPKEVQTEVAKRLAEMDRTSPEVVQEVEKVLKDRLLSIGGQDYTAAGGIGALVDILNRADRATEKTILEDLEEQDPVLAEEVKKLMFVFEDIVLLDDRSIQTVLKEVDMKDLALALKAASEAVMKRIISNMSDRAAEMLKEDIEFMGPVRLRIVEDAQQRIVNIIRRLDDAGEIVISRGKEDEILV